MGSQQISTAQNIEQPIVLQPNAPWFQTNGQLTPDGILKEVSSKWGEKMWEAYLAWFESGQSETLFRPKVYDMACEEMEDSAFIFAQSNADIITRERVSKILNKLTSRQREVIVLLFWNSMTERAVALHLGQSRSAVRDTKRRALDRLKRLLKLPPTSPHIMRGESSPLVKGELDDKENDSLAKGVFPKAS